MKEYLIAYQYFINGQDWRWAAIIKRCKMTGANLQNIEDEICRYLDAHIVRIMHFSELESDSEGV